MTDYAKVTLADPADREKYWFNLALEDAFLDMLEEEQEQEEDDDA